MGVWGNYEFPLGRNLYGRPVAVDIWDGTNNNILIVGDAGSGKTTTAKHIALQQYYRGVKVIIVDFYGEYRDFCEALGGYWVGSDYITAPQDFLSAKLLVFDLYDFKRAGKQQSDSHISKILTWAWDCISANTDEKVLFILDNFTSLCSEQTSSQLISMYSLARFHNCAILSVAHELGGDVWGIGRNSGKLIIKAHGFREFGDLLDIFGSKQKPRELLNLRRKYLGLYITAGCEILLDFELPADEKFLLALKSKWWKDFW